MNMEKEILMAIVDNPITMGKIDNYIEIDSIEDFCNVKPYLINSTVNKLYKNGFVNLNRNLVRITNKGIDYLNMAA